MKEFLMQTAALSMIRLVMDMALPENDLKRYADLGVGLCLMLRMLEEILNIWQQMGG